MVAALAADPASESDTEFHWIRTLIPNHDDPVNATVLELATSPVDRLALALFDKLLTIADDHHNAAENRADALEGAEILLPHVSAHRAMKTIVPLLALSSEPRFGPHDDPEVNGLDPLQGFSIDFGGRTLPTLAIRTASFAYDTAVTADLSLSESELASDIAVRAAIQMRSEDDRACRLAADAAVAISAHTAFDLGLLATHRLAAVRAKAIHAWKRSASSWGILPRHLASDPSAFVRRTVAFELPAIKQRNVAYEVLVQKLKNDPSFAVRHTARRFEDAATS